MKDTMDPQKNKKIVRLDERIWSFQFHRCLLCVLSFIFFFLFLVAMLATSMNTLNWFHMKWSFTILPFWTHQTIVLSIELIPVRFKVTFKLDQWLEFDWNSHTHAHWSNMKFHFVFFLYNTKLQSNWILNTNIDSTNEPLDWTECIDPNATVVPFSFSHNFFFLLVLSLDLVNSVPNVFETILFVFDSPYWHHQHYWSAVYFDYSVLSHLEWFHLILSLHRNLNSGFECTLNVNWFIGPVGKCFPFIIENKINGDWRMQMSKNAK